MYLRFHLYHKHALAIVLLAMFFYDSLLAQDPVLNGERSIDIQDQIDQFEDQLKGYYSLEEKLALEERLFEQFHKSILKLKNNPGFISNIKLSNQYQNFEQQSKELQELRNKTSRSLRKIEQQREKLLLHVENEIQTLKSSNDSNNQQQIQQLKTMSAIYDQYADLSLKSTPMTQSIDIPNELDSEKIIALKDILTSLDKKIADLGKNLKHKRRSQFIRSSMMDTLSEESFFSEGQFIHSGEQNSVVNENAFNALNKAAPDRTEGQNPDISGQDMSVDGITDLRATSPSAGDMQQRSIDSIEAKRNVKGALNLGERSINENIQDIENKLIFLQAERLKIIHELQKQ